MNALVTLVELIATAPGGGAGRTVRTATRNAVALRGESRRDFPADLQGHPTFEWGIFAAGRLDGPTVADFGALTLVNRSGGYDDLLPLIGGAWTITAWQIELADDQELAGDLDVLAPMFTGRCGVPRSSLAIVEIPLRSPLRGFDRALETSTFAGTNVGTTGDEGEPALANQVRPTTLGYCLHVPAAISNGPAHRQEVNNGPVEAITGAFLNGEVTAHTTDAANGRYTYSVNPATLARTAHVRGDKPDGVYRSTAGDLISSLATARAGVASVDAGDLAVVNAARPHEVGYFTSTRTTIRTAADFLGLGGEIFYLVDPAGILRMGVLEAPSGDPAVTLTQAHLREVADGSDLEFVPIAPHGSIEEVDPASLGDDGGLPVWRVVCKGMRHWVGGLAENQIAAGLDDDARAELRTEWREEVAEDPAVLAAFPDAAEVTLETGLTTLSDMKACADRHLAIRKHPQQIARVRVANRYLIPWMIGQTVQLHHERFDLSGGVLLRVIRRLNEGTHSVLDLWRPVIA
jgi:hypothetical protein